MKIFKIHSLRQKNKILEQAYIKIDDEGKILSISESGIKFDEEIAGITIPGFINNHSHAFQYAMAGLSEKLAPGHVDDDFWTWRNLMYQLALTLSPDDIQSIATMVYAEMARVGYTWVTEFHYLHHDVNGQAYINLPEMSERLINAASDAGIGITIVPMYYQRGGFNQEIADNQKRFFCSNVDNYQKLFENIRSKVNATNQVQIGVGVHSIRAAKKEDIQILLNEFYPHLPRHIHIAEQVKEVEECVAILGARPVQWFSNQVNLNHAYHLVHATHIDSNEIKLIVNNKANVVLCPSTEGNLGDGFFPIADYWKKGGRWSIGSDSHICLNPMEECRWPDYYQRMHSKKRNSLCFAGGENSGDKIYQETYLTGRSGAGMDCEDFFNVGDFFNAVVIDDQSPIFANKGQDHFFSTLIYSADPSSFIGTINAGKWVVKNGIHLQRDMILKNYQNTTKEISAKLN